MPANVFFLVLFAAFLHASWNIIVKGGSNKLYETALHTLGSAIGAIFILPFLPLPAVECLPLLAISCFCHLAYYFCMAATYKVADLSVGYAIMRGSAPILTAVALAIFGRPLNYSGWLSIFFLSAGILILGFQQKKSGSITGILYALRTSLVIMCYTLADGFGAREAGSGASYACWLFLINFFPINLYVFWRYRADYCHYAKIRAVPGIAGGLFGMASYGIAIWAMTAAPIALVAGLRETSVIFGLILAIIFLHEKFTFARVAAIFLVAGGAMLARLG